MEHEMRLAVIPFGGDGDAHPMVMPYCVGCGWVGERRYTFTTESVSADWRMHVKEFNESEDRRIAAWLEHQRARRDAVDPIEDCGNPECECGSAARPDASPTHAQEATDD